MISTLEFYYASNWSPILSIVLFISFFFEENLLQILIYIIDIFFFIFSSIKYLKKVTAFFFKIMYKI